MSRRSFEGLAVGAAVASLFAACSDTAYYPLCDEPCAAAGAAGASEPGNSSGKASTGGRSASGGGGGTSAAGSGAPNAGAPPDSDGGAAGETTGGSAGSIEEQGGSAGEAGATGSSCNASLSPIDEPCLVSDAFAVFAKASTEAGGGDGSLGSPFGSLAEAIRVADEQSKPLVIACISTFREPITITRRSGSTLRIVGGFNCTANGAEYFGQPSTLEAASGPTLQLIESSDIELSDFEVRASDARSAGESSIAAVIARSERVRFNRVKVVAGEGFDGARGGPSPQRIAQAPTGNPGQGSSGGALQNLCTCSESIGGRGGDIEATSTRDGGNGLPALGGGKGGAGGASCQKGEGGKAPGSGENGPGGVLGELDATNWLPAAGSRGGDGAVGQGGGGGGGGPTGGGGGGGCGGCGGQGGEPGQGGGASIGVLVIDSELSLSDCSIETSDAGAGGDGAPGQPGQAGGGGGSAATTGCAGGIGGQGGDGGGGGGGAGGVSVGILYSGSLEPDISAVTFTLGNAGEGGVGGGTDNSGLPGKSAKLLPIGP